MSDRNRRKFRRLLVRYTLLAILTFLVFRQFGPALVSVRGGSLAPVIAAGDVLLVRRNTSELHHGTTVLVDAPIRTGTTIEDLLQRVSGTVTTPAAVRAVRGPVLRVVAGLPGETIRWNNEGLFRDGEFVPLEPLHPELTAPEQTLRLEDGEFFLITLQPGRGDSRVVGPIHRDSIRFRVQSIIWPRERRRVLPLIHLE